ncbi:hypothetical protein BCU68_14005 [Vibrio sp. 10N.286.49.B3]|uniref:autotransporter assembly complex protein TamB n=1 Tax=Vibrio sp. 10N.286.49.B3 TaxID=1880855 RepID=UPI000C82BF9D|nr:translocation/assembly module TamB domain-containing protein [Vibrio sp. 10N.286.49.B3]PMH42548.1 hypothetical protein BCU68_14005 [Vibrio sp. 10N.286.49.B3]
MIKVMLKISKWLLITLFSLILLLTLLVAILLFTNAGLNGALWGAQKALPQLSIEETEGALFPDFTLKGISFRDSELAIDAKLSELNIAINPHCFLAPSVCIDVVKVDGLHFSLPNLPASTEEPEPSDPIESISIPIPITVSQLQLANINLDILGNHIQWSLFSTALAMEEDRLTINPTVLNNIIIELASQEEGSPQVEPPAQSHKERVAITLPSVWIPLDIDIQSIEISDARLQQEEPIVIERLKLIAQAKGHEVQLETLELVMPQVDAALSADVTLDGDYPLISKLNATLKEDDFKGQQLQLETQGSVANLQLQATLGGVVDSRLSGQLQPLEPTLPFSIDIHQLVTQWPLVGDSDYQIERANAQASGSLDGYKIALSTQLSGKAIPSLGVDLAGEGTLKQIDLSSITVKSLGGEVSGQVMANWQEPINWQANLQLSDIQPGLQWEEAEGKISGTLQTTGSLTTAGGWQVDLPLLNIDGVLRDYPLNIDGQLQASDKAGKGDIVVRTTGLSLAHGPNSLKAQGQLDQNWDMGIEVDFPSFGKSVPDLQGEMQGRIQLKGKQQEPNINVDLNLSSVTWQELASIESLSLVGDVSPLPAPQGNVKLKAANLAYEENIIDSIELLASGDESEHQLTLDVISNVASTSLAIRGEFKQATMQWLGQLERMNLLSEQGEWLLDKPTSIDVDIDKQQANIQAHCWLQSDSSLCLEDDISVGESGEARLTINSFNFDQVKQFAPEETELEGEVNANLLAKWSPDNTPELKVKVVVPKGKLTKARNSRTILAWHSMTLNAELKQDQLIADWLLDIANNGEILGQLTLPDIVDENKPVDGNVIIRDINLAFLKPLIGGFSTVKADINSNVAIKGSLVHPQLDGQLVVDNINVEGDISPVGVKSGRVDLELNGYSAILKSVITTDDGDLQLSGHGNWADLADWSTNLRIFADELQVDVPPMVKMKVIPDMTIQVNPELARVDGNINLPWGRIFVESLPQSAVGISDDQVIVDKDLKPVDEATIPFDIETNITISIGDDFKLTAFGLESYLEGKLNVTQKDKGPFIAGEVNLVDGTYTSFGQDLLIEEGKILMNGPADQPYLAIEAIRNPDNTEDDVTAGVRVTGPASEPVIEIYSDPAMPQANALSYLLRGQDIDGESGGNAMTTTLIGLSLAKSGQVVGQIGEAFGVQDLQLDTAGSGDDSQVTVSGYILPGLQVKYGVGIFNSLGEFTIRYRLLQDLYLEVVSGLDSSVDLLYQFEFD